MSKATSTTYCNDHDTANGIEKRRRREGFQFVRSEYDVERFRVAVIATRIDADAYESMKAECQRIRDEADARKREGR